MKTMLRNSVLLLLVLIAFVLMSSFITRQQKDADQLLLEIEGKPLFDKHAKGTYRVVLIYLNSVVDTLVVPVNQSFDYMLYKDQIYAVRVEKEGYFGRLISINTSMPEASEEQSFYSFEFKIEMYEQELEPFLDPDDVDFPAAVIAYDERSGKFDYSRIYSNDLLQRLDECRSYKITRR